MNRCVERQSVDLGPYGRGQMLGCWRLAFGYNGTSTMPVFSSCKSLPDSSIKVYEEDLLLSLISDIPESPAHSTFHGRR